MEKHDLTSNVESNKTNTSQILQTVMDNQGKILIDIESELEMYNETLPEQITELGQLRQNIAV